MLNGATCGSIACLCRWGVVSTEYDWNDSDDGDNELEQALEEHFASLPVGESAAEPERLVQVLP